MRLQVRCAAQSTATAAQAEGLSGGGGGLQPGHGGTAALEAGAGAGVRLTDPIVDRSEGRFARVVARIAQGSAPHRELSVERRIVLRGRLCGVLPVARAGGWWRGRGQVVQRGAEQSVLARAQPAAAAGGGGEGGGGATACGPDCGRPWSALRAACLASARGAGRSSQHGHRRRDRQTGLSAAATDAAARYQPSDSGPGDHLINRLEGPRELCRKNRRGPAGDDLVQLICHFPQLRRHPARWVDTPLCSDAVQVVAIAAKAVAARNQALSAHAATSAGSGGEHPPAAEEAAIVESLRRQVAAELASAKAKLQGGLAKLGHS